MNIFKLFYRKAVGLMDRLHVYEERTGKYVDYFKRYVDDVKIIVDIGCGEGAFSKALADGKRLVIALDIDEGALRRIKSPLIERVWEDAHHLPLRESSIDCVLSLSLLEHLENPGKAVEELRRVLSHGGVAVIQLPNPQYLFEPHTKWPLLYLLPKRIRSRIFRMIGYPYVNVEFTINWLMLIMWRVFM